MKNLENILLLPACLKNGVDFTCFNSVVTESVSAELNRVLQQAFIARTE